MYKANSALLILLLVIPAALGCSGPGRNPVEPPDAPESLAMAETSSSNRVLWGMWDISFDTVNREISITPARYALAHFDITDWLLPPNCDDCFAVMVNSFDPVTRILDADVTLRNPTQLSGYDVRGILYTNDYGHLLKNADAWTDLWEMPGGEEINPFKAFAKTEANRIFVPDAEHTENYRIYIPIPPNWNQITFAVDASWPGNCKEPYAIENFWQETIFETSGSAGNLYIDVLDWQGDVSTVSLISPEITGEDPVPFSLLDENTWQLELINAEGLAAGDYKSRVTVESANSGSLALNDIITIAISETGPGVPYNPVDVTPPWLNVSPREVAIDGDYAYIAGWRNGLHIYNISDPSNPAWVNWVATPEEAFRVTAAGGYAFVLDAGFLHIIDVSPVESAHIANTIDTSSAQDIAVSGSYAYVAEYSGLSIIDIDPVETAHEVKFAQFSLGHIITGIAVSGGYVYVLEQSGIAIFDVEPVESAQFVNMAPGVEDSEGLCVVDGYAFVSGSGFLTTGLWIVDVDPVESPEVVKHVWTQGQAYSLSVSNGYAFVGDSFGLSIIDIDPIESADLVNVVIMPWWGEKVAVSDGHAYVTEHHYYGNGVRIIDIEPVESAQIISSIESVYDAVDVVVSNGYAYVTDYNGSLVLIDIEPLETAHIVKSIHKCSALGLSVSGDYAFVAAGNKLKIIDIEPPESADIINAISIPNGARDVDVSDGFAYVTNNYDFVIIDIEPVESAYIVNAIDTESYYVAISDGYAFALAYNGSLKIIDIDPVESAHIVQFVASPGSDIAVSNGYAFEPYGQNLKIIDVDPAESAEVINTLFTPGYKPGVAVSGEYAYCTFYNSDDIVGLQVFDISPAEHAHMISQVEMPGETYGIERVAVSGNYAYVANGEKGLRIIQLW